MTDTPEQTPPPASPPAAAPPPPVDPEIDHGAGGDPLIEGP